MVEYYQGLWKTLWLLEGEKKEVDCHPKLFKKYLLFSLETGKHKIFWEFYRTLHLNNVFTE